MTYQEPTHELGRIMLARHKAQDCVFGCPFCKQEEEQTMKQEALEVPYYEVMPRNPQAEGLEFQAGVYAPVNGMHALIAEVYGIQSAHIIADLLTIIASPLLRSITREEKSDEFVIRIKDSLIPEGGNLIFRHLAKAADYIRQQSEPRLDEFREEIMQHHGLKGEWRKWEL